MNVTIPSSVISIGDYAFYGCDSLMNVTIPDGVTSIGALAFGDCNSLMNVTIGTGVTSIDEIAFRACESLTSITVDNQNQYYCSIDGNLFDKNKKTLIQYAIGKQDSQYTIPSSVTNVGYGAFEKCKSLTSVIIPNSVTSIGNYAFESCDSLMNVIIGNGVTSIGDWAFEECYRLMSVTIPNSVTSIGKGAFVWCSSLTSVTIPDSVTSIDNSAFEWCESLTDVYYSGSEADWQGIDIGDYNEDLTGATIHYNSAEPPRIEVSEPIVEGGSITITAETKSIDGEGELFAVGYDGNKLTASEKLQDGAATLPAEDVQTIKVFCWDSLDTMRPLCEPKTITIK